MGRTLRAIACVATVAFPARAQGPAILTGRITSEQGFALEAANVLITELQISVQVQANGVYTITIPSERVRGQTVMLRARAIGYAAAERQMTLTEGTQTVDFALKRDINRLQEIVITGVTGATEIKKTPFAITGIDEADLPVPSTNMFSGLQGKVTGAQIVMPSGRPGAVPSIVLRGPKSLNAEGRSQGPLMIVDGVIVTAGSQDLNPSDIESVEIVKGAAASSLYGSRAGAGVIQVRTKNGRNASPGVRFNGRTEYGFSDIQGRYPYSTRHFLRMDETMTRFCVVPAEVAGAEDLPSCSFTVDFEDEAFRVNQQGGDVALTPYRFERDFGISASPTRQELKGIIQINHWPRRYDPVEQVATLGQFSNSNIDMTGRFGSTSYFASASSLREEGSIAFLKGYSRGSTRLNVDQQLGDDWTVTMSSFYSRATEYPDGSFFRVTRTPPSVNLLRRDDRGRLFVRSNPLNQGLQNANPLYDNESFFSETKTDRFLGSVTARFTPLSWLEFDGNASADRRRADNFSLIDRGTRTTAPIPIINEGNAAATAAADASYNVGLNGTVRRNFGDDLASRFNVRYTYEQEDNSLSIGSGSTLALPNLRSLDAVTANQALSSGAASVRAIGTSAGTNFEYKERYIIDALYRYDGSSLFGADERWHGYYRGSLAWRASEEPWWYFPTAINDLKLRASLGTAGGRPSFPAQYETFALGEGGHVTAETQGNRELKPERTREIELGVDAELFSKYGVSITRAHDVTADQIVLYTPPAATGFASRWVNGGTLEGKTWELSLNLPLLTRQSLVWSTRLGWDRTVTHITALSIAPFDQQLNNASTFRFAVGERIGTIYGKKFITSCSEFPANFRDQCGPGQDWQANDEGLIVWVGAGNSVKDGIRKNLYQAVRPGCLSASGATINVTGEVACANNGGVVNNPWGQPEVHWGMPTAVRDSTGNERLMPLGNTLPDWRLTMTQTFQYKRLSVHALVDHSHGNSLMNQEIHWSLGDFMVDVEDQTGKTVENAKPIGYYWRATCPENCAGIGGLYDVLGANSFTVQSGQYTKLREVSVGYQLGAIRGVAGDWNLSLVGRNLYTLTGFKGWDPEVGLGGGDLNAPGITSVAAFQYPPRRTFTFALGSRF